MAAENKYLNEDILQKFHKEHICNYAARMGNLELLKLARKQNPPRPWNIITCTNAAENGHLDILIWMREQDPPCPLNEWACSYAAKNGYIDIVWYLYNIQAPIGTSWFIHHDNCAAFFVEFGEDWKSGRFELIGRNIKG